MALISGWAGSVRSAPCIEQRHEAPCEDHARRRKTAKSSLRSKELEPRAVEPGQQRAQAVELQGQQVELQGRWQVNKCTCEFVSGARGLELRTIYCQRQVALSTWVISTPHILRGVAMECFELASFRKSFKLATAFRMKTCN